jgi:hypothetical protein
MDKKHEHKLELNKGDIIYRRTIYDDLDISFIEKVDNIFAYALFDYEQKSFLKHIDDDGQFHSIEESEFRDPIYSIETPELQSEYRKKQLYILTTFIDENLQNTFLTKELFQEIEILLNEVNNKIVSCF